MKNMFLLFVVLFVGFAKGSEGADQQMGSAPIACQLKKVIIDTASDKNTHIETSKKVIASDRYCLRLDKIVPAYNKLIPIHSVAYKNDNLIIKTNLESLITTTYNEVSDNKNGMLKLTIDKQQLAAFYVVLRGLGRCDGVLSVSMSSLHNTSDQAKIFGNFIEGKSFLLTQEQISQILPLSWFWWCCYKFDSVIHFLGYFLCVSLLYTQFLLAKAI